MTETSLHHCTLDQILHDEGMRCSKDRHVLLDLFGEDRAWTGNELRTILHHTAKSTIYKNMDILQKKEVIHPIQFNGKTYYEMTGREHHDHQVCTKCGGAYCIDCQIPKIKNHFLQIAFLCRACKK